MTLKKSQSSGPEADTLILGLEGDGMALMLDRLSRGESSFWTDVKDPFLNRDLRRKDVRHLLHLALSAVGGNYRQVVRLLGLPDRDYRRLLNFLSHHDCKLDFRPYRRQALR